MRAILTFHSVDDTGSVMSVTAAQLRSLVRSIRASGHRIVPLAELLDEPGEAGRIALTFDDGIASVHDAAMPVLAEESAPATLFLATGRVGRDTRWPSLREGDPVFPMMGWAQVEALVRAGWDIQAHTVNHPHLPELSPQEIEDEMARCDESIHERLGVRPRIFAYPYGSVNASASEVAARRYAYALTTRMGEIPPVIDQPQLLPRLEVFYFRDPRAHSRFGSPLFRGYLGVRTMLRNLRGG